MDEATIREKTAQEACRLKVDCTYAFKSHFEAEQYWSRFDLGTGVIIAILAAVAGGLALYPDKDWSAYAGIVALIASVLTSLVTVVKTDEKARLHHAAGCRLNALMIRIRNFQELDCPVRPIEELREKLDKFLEEKSDINESSPGYSGYFYWKAKRGIKKGQAKYPECDEEFSRNQKVAVPQPIKPSQTEGDEETGKPEERKPEGTG
jgi:hypothetical protein